MSDARERRVGLIEALDVTPVSKALAEARPRRPLLDLPFSWRDHDGVVFVDDPDGASLTRRG